MEKTLNILEEIAAKTRERVAEAKKKISLEDMKKKAESIRSGYRLLRGMSIRNLRPPDLDM